jgi:hypothetical protein
MDYTQARQYLAKVVPWDGRNYVSIHYKVVGKHGRPILPGVPSLNVDGAMGTVKYRAGTDVYVSMASQSKADERTAPTGRKYLVAMRTLENVALHKSLYVDIDVKGKGYDSTASAKRALRDFLLWSTLPSPTVIVESGTGGLHVYWTLVDAVSMDVWRPLAFALVGLAQQFGLKFDSQCSVDPVRLLRVPDTFNHKAGGPYPVKLVYLASHDIFIDKLKAVLDAFVPENLPTLASNSGGDDLSAGIVRNALPPSDPDRVATVCPMWANALATGGNGILQPLWMQHIRLATCCENGRDVAHRLSCGDPRYSKDETDEIYDRLVQERVDKPSIGPPRCATLKTSGAYECDSCGHLGANLVPLNLPGAFAQRTPAGIPVGRGDDLLPEGYIRGPDGHIYGSELDETTQIEKRVLVFPYMIIDPYVEGGREYAVHFTTVEEGNVYKSVRIPFVNLADRNSSAKSLSAEGLPMRVTERVQDFLTSFLKKLRDSSGSIVRCEPLGWHLKDGDIEGFAYNGVLHTTTGEKIAQRLDATTRPNYTPTGTPDAWMAAVRIINSQRRPALDTLILSAFSSPLLALTNQVGVSIGGWSNESGVGKTTALQIALGAWGHPIRTGGGLSDTANATFHRAGLIRHLPLVWDEIKTQKQTSNFLETIFTMTSGLEKARLNRSAKAQHQGAWQSILTYASNSSMSDAIIEQSRSTTAGHVRVFEFQVPRVDNVVAVSTMARCMDKLRGNYGHAGAIYAKWLGANHVSARGIVDRIFMDFETKLVVKEDERLWNAAMAATLAGGFFANKLGLTQVDLPLLRAWLVSEFQRMRTAKNVAPNDFSKEMSILNALGQFLNEKRPVNTIRTNTIPPGKGKPPPNSVLILNEGTSADRLGDLHVQIAVGLKVIRIADYALTAWCKKENIPKSAMVEGMRSKLSARWTSCRLGSGTRLAGSTVPCWELLVAGTPIDDIVDW